MSEKREQRQASKSHILQGARLVPDRPLIGGVQPEQVPPEATNLKSINTVRSRMINDIAA
ncbi:hypothetical protein CVT26_001888 [Gymnopilus dilepis]|uniref:Uncharacterized protein n=1 Tax=Gymnopilus dilepis TaxID=231916 RepID=A0A409Y3W9_9AGAR|nr:hypothetical protein CVT26_001888 [Gymnopilus dilepis]